VFPSRTDLLNTRSRPLPPSAWRVLQYSHPEMSNPVPFALALSATPGTRLAALELQTHIRKAFFNHHPRSRSAYLRGGIIWRLALETAGALADESVLGGPSEETLTCGACVQCDGVVPLWDDGLSEADIDVICGVYKYETGASVQCITYFLYSASALLETNNQTSDLSWWPKQSTFVRSGLWPGYWSRSCEDWYQRRHNDIVSGRADLKTGAQWQKAMVLYQKVTKLKKANSKAAALYIERHGTLLR
jgi:hypothetical protein